jgi:SAM-dependent methyltransferase
MKFMPNSPPDWGTGEEYFGPRHAYRLHLILKLRPKVPCLCLDAACGLGTLSEKLKVKGFKPVGMDLDIGAAQATLRKGFPVVIGRMEALPFKSGTIPAFFSSETLEHLDDVEPAVLEIHRVLIPNGALILSVPANMVYWSTWDRWAGHRRRFDPAMLRQDFKPLRLQRAFSPGFPFLLLYEMLFLRGFVQKRAEGQVDVKGKWSILKNLLSGPLALLFRLNLPVKSKATGIVASFKK